MLTAKRCWFAVAVLGLLVMPARASLIFKTELLPGNEVPPHDTPAHGFAEVTLHDDGVTLDVDLTFSNLTAPAVAAHIHAAAPPGLNAPVRLPFPDFPAATSGAFSHTFNLSTDLTGIS